MIASSRFAAAAAVGLALGVHATGLIDYSSTETIQIEGGTPVSIAALGNSFADMARGSATPVAAASYTTTRPVDKIKPIEPTPAQQSLQPPPTNVPPTPRAKSVPTSPVSNIASGLVQMPAVATPLANSQAPLRATTAPAAETVQPSVLSPQKVRKVAPTSEETANQPQPETAQKVTPKIKPKQRPVRKTAENPTQKSVAQPKGNSDRNARKGAATGSQKPSTGQSEGKSKRSTAQGNAAVSNYPGIVFHKISRASRQRVKAKGKVRVTFRIAGNGSLASVSVARSSGSPQLDKIAVAQIRSAAPFPPPPAGAKTSFSMEIRGR